MYKWAKKFSFWLGIGAKSSSHKSSSDAGKSRRPCFTGENHGAAETNVSGLSLPKKLVTNPWGES